MQAIHSHRGTPEDTEPNHDSEDGSYIPSNYDSASDHADTQSIGRKRGASSMMDIDELSNLEISYLPDLEMDDSMSQSQREESSSTSMSTSEKYLADVQKQKKVLLQRLSQIYSELAVLPDP